MMFSVTLDHLISRTLTSWLIGRIKDEILNQCTTILDQNYFSYNSKIYLYRGPGNGRSNLSHFFSEIFFTVHRTPLHATCINKK
jgi:hypothetical protein